MTLKFNYQLNTNNIATLVWFCMFCIYWIAVNFATTPRSGRICFLCKFQKLCEPALSLVRGAAHFHNFGQQPPAVQPLCVQKFTRKSAEKVRGGRVKGGGRLSCVGRGWWLGKTNEMHSCISRQFAKLQRLMLPRALHLCFFFALPAPCFYGKSTMWPSREWEA